jgi:hypothetical protein
MVLNPNTEPATVSLVFYWEDKPPTSVHGLVVEGVRCIRIDRRCRHDLWHRAEDVSLRDDRPHLPARH